MRELPPELSSLTPGKTITIPELQMLVDAGLVACIYKGAPEQVRAMNAPERVSIMCSVDPYFVLPLRMELGHIHADMLAAAVGWQGARWQHSNTGCLTLRPPLLWQIRQTVKRWLGRTA